MLTLHKDAASFLEAAQHRLMKQEALNNLILGIALRLKDSPDSYTGSPPYLATWAEQNGTLTYAALMTPPYGLLVATFASALDEPVTAVVESLHSGGWPVPSVNAPAPTAAHFARLWAKHTRRSAVVDVRERLFQLTKVIPPANPSGHFRKARESDIPTLAQWIASFRAEALPNEPPIDGLRFATQRLDVVYVWDDGGLVSMMANNRNTIHLASVGLVYTPPELRGKGYATALVAAGSQALLDAGHTGCVLFTDLANPISNSIYPKIGYQPVADFELYRFRDA